jgi:YVTN family beta-propeller protein
VAVNPATNTVYVANIYDGTGGNSVSVIDGASLTTQNSSVGSGPDAVDLNPLTNMIYVANSGSDTVSVINGATGWVEETVAAGTYPEAVAVNPATNMIYVANQNSNNVTVIDGATNAATTVNVGSFPYAVAVNPLTNMIYVANLLSNTVTVMNGATNATTTVNVGSGPAAVALNPLTNMIYVANQNSNNVTVIDGATNATTTVAVGTHPEALAVNPETNTIYVANYLSDTVTVINGASNATTTVAVGTDPDAVAVNPLTNTIYVGNYGSDNITVINGATNATATVAGFAATPRFVAVNPVTNTIYVADQNGSSVTVINGASNTPTTVSTGTVPYAIAINPVTNTAYVPCNESSGVTIITEQQEQSIPLVASIEPLSGGDQTDSPTPTFNVQVNSSFYPTAPTPQALWYQMDTWQGQWLRASGTEPNFTLTTPTLSLGTHILYAFATDGQDANSTGMAQQLIGGMAAYAFMVIPATTVTLTPASLAFGNQAIDSTSAAKSVTLKNTGTATLSIGSIAITSGSDFTISANTCGATLAADKTCKVSVDFAPTQLGAATSTLSFTDDASGSPQTVPLTGTGIAQATLTPASYTFKETKVGDTSAAYKFTLTNNLPTTLTGISYSTAAPFEVSASTCGTTLDSKKSCTISVKFTPTSEETFNGTLTVTDSANNSPQTSSLSGTGD